MKRLRETCQLIDEVVPEERRAGKTSSCRARRTYMAALCSVQGAVHVGGVGREGKKIDNVY